MADVRDSSKHPVSAPSYEELLERVAQLERQQEQQQLDRERLLALIDSLPEDIFFVDAGGKVVLVNDAVRSSLGVTDKENVYKRLADAESMFEVYAPEGRRRAPDESPFLAALKGQVVHGEEVVRNVTTGELRHREYHVAPVVVGGKVAGAVSAVRDITKRKRVEEQLRRRQAEIQTLLENTPAGLVLFEGARPYEVLAHNRYYQELFAEPFRSEGMVGLSLFDYASAIEAEGVVAVCDEVVRTKRPASFLDFPYKSSPPKQSWFNWHLSPLILDGKVVALVSMSLDVTERHLAEESLRHTRARLAEGQQIAHVGSFEYVVATRTTIWSEEEYRIYGLDPAGASPEYGDLLARCIHPDDAALLHETFSKALQSGTVYELEHRIVRPDGSVRWVYDRAQPHFDESGSLARYVGATLDITERKQAEEALRQSRQTFAELVERAPFGMYIVDSAFRIAYMNAGSQTGAFANVRPVIGRPFSEAIHILWPDELAEEIIGHFRRTLETGEPYLSPRFVNPRADIDAVEGYEWELHRIALPEGQLGVICYYFDSTELRRAEHAVRESEARFRSVLENVRDVLYRVNLETDRFEYISPSCQAMVGYSAAELTALDGPGALAMIHPEDLPAMRAALARLEATGTSEAEYRQRTRSGDYRWMSNRMSLVRDADGRAVYRDGNIRDITDRKQAEKELREGEERLRLTLQASAVGTFEVDLTTGEGRWNVVEYELLGLKPGDAPADPETFFRYVHPGDLAELRARWEEAARTGRFDAEFRVIRADGQERWLAGKGQFAFAETADAGSAGGKRSPLRFLGVNFDITERRQAEEARAASRHQLQAIIDNAPAIIYAFDLEHRFVMANAALAALLDSTPEQMLGKRRQELMPKEDAEWHEANDRQVIEASRALEFEEHSQLKGRSITWLTTKFPLRDLQGRTYAVGGISADISERKRAAEGVGEANRQLAEADRRKDEFLAVLGHELRNPLAPIRNSVYLLQKVQPGGAQALRAVQIIDRQSAHLSRLVDDLLDLNRISRGKVELHHERVDLADLVFRTAEDHRPRFLDKNISLEVQVAHAPLWVNGDPTRIVQIVGNLLTNARKFTPNGGGVWVELATEESRAVLRVRDTGMGIAPDLLRTIFDPFTQAEQTLARSQGGLGLGLALARGFVEMHGGSISAASAGPGQGAELTVMLPLLERVLLDDVRLVAAEPARPQRVVVVEDNPDAAESLRDVLVVMGHEVRVAFDGASGLAAVRELQPDVLLCDIGLPDIDGYVVARAVRADPGLGSCRLVALTGYAQPEDVAKAMEAGFDAHLAKPPSLERLRELLSDAPGGAGPAGEPPEG